MLREAGSCLKQDDNYLARQGTAVTANFITQTMPLLGSPFREFVDGPLSVCASSFGEDFSLTN